MTRLANHFGRNRRELRSIHPLGDDQLRNFAPAIFAQTPHAMRSQRYVQIPTADVLQGLRKEGFEPFFCATSVSRKEDRQPFTKHMLRLRHASQIAQREANEVILLNSHDGSSAYQMMAGMFRFVCANGLVCGDVNNDVRVKHTGRAVDDVIEGAFRVLDDFEAANDQRDAMQALTLNEGEQNAFARAAIALRFDADVNVHAPVSEAQVLRVRRAEDRAGDFWTVFNRVQENVVRGGLPGRTATGRNFTSRAVQGIDGNVTLNRSLWILAEEMRRLKATH
jgi:hypothetical protein